MRRSPLIFILLLMDFFAWPSKDYCTPVLEDLSRDNEEVMREYQRYGAILEKCSECGCKLKTRKRDTPDGFDLVCNRTAKHSDGKTKVFSQRPQWMQGMKTYPMWVLHQMLYFRAVCKEGATFFKNVYGLTSTKWETLNNRFRNLCVAIFFIIKMMEFETN